MGSQFNSAMRSTTTICLIFIGAVLALVEAKPWVFEPHQEGPNSFEYKGTPCIEDGEDGCMSYEDCCKYDDEHPVCTMIGMVAKDVGQCASSPIGLINPIVQSNPIGLINRIN